AELKRRGLTVLRTDNTGHEGTRARGASAKRDDVGASWLLRPDEHTPGVFSLVPTKRRSAPGRSGALTFRRHTDEAGLLHFDPVEGAGAPTFGQRLHEARVLLDRIGVPRDSGQRKAREAGMEELRRMEAAGEPVPPISARDLERAQKERRLVIEVVTDHGEEV
ncbi:MAG: hypothetical protein Q4G64_08835, partial [bacterium]|nr:hypothetical protein [bacterium]